MRNYNKNEPLIVIHVPKTGGTSTLEIYKKWFGRKFYSHYYNEYTGELPNKVRLKKFLSKKYRNNICIYGHFNKYRGFGIEKYYPEIKQFITLVRDPFEIAISEYFFINRHGYKWRDKSRIPSVPLLEYLDNCKPNMLNHFPFELTLDNYKELIEKYFIHIGITEEIDISMNVIAKKLGFTLNDVIKKKNVTKRDEFVPYNFKEKFVEKNRIEFAVYEYAKKNYYEC